MHSDARDFHTPKRSETMMRWRVLLLLPLALLGPTWAAGKAVVFWEPGFPSVETPSLTREVLEQALHPLNPVFAAVSDLEKPDVLGEGALLVLPYGSAFPGDAWPAIQAHLPRGNLLNIGGRPLSVPVWRSAAGWRTGRPQNGYSRSIGIEHTYVAPHSAGHFQWDDRVLFPSLQLGVRRVFVAAGEDDPQRRGIGFLINEAGERVAAPVVAQDVFPAGEADQTSLDAPPPAARRVFLNFEADPGFWASPAGRELIHNAADYAARGPLRLFLDLDRLTVEPGERASATVDVLRRTDRAARITVGLHSGQQTLASAEFTCSAALHHHITFAPALTKPGLYSVRATLWLDGTAVERYTSGLWVRDSQLLASGAALQAGRDYFRLAGMPYLPVGANYFSTDPFGASFFVGGSLGGNAWVWERDFAEMERRGVSFVRTGVWLNRWRYLEQISGGAEERLLKAIEAFLHSAVRHHMQVVFTFFAFEPQTVEQRESPSNRLGPGRNPYTDPGAVRAQAAWVATIAQRLKDIPSVSFDLINEPSFSNPRRLWKGNTPNDDPSEQAAWRQWLVQRYPSTAALAEAWNIPAGGFRSFSSVPLPGVEDLGQVRYGNPKLAQAVDYNRFAQEAFRRWADEMIRVIRQTGATQLVTVGQDEGGVTDRLLNFFLGDSGVNYTTNHSWWRDDALLWDSLAAKRPDKPNLIEETGPQPVWSMNSSWRWDEMNALPLLERKLALGFAAGNAGSLHWDWARGDTFGLLRSDGSFKQWIEVLSGLARFARAAQPYATEVRLPEIALVLPQSLQLSVFNEWALEAQQKCVRGLYYYARASAYAVGEYQIERIGTPKLIIVPAPWTLRQAAWEAILERVRSGATLLISGRIDLDEHFLSVEGRTRGWLDGYAPTLLTTRENLIEWAGGSAQLTYSGNKTTFAERGSLPGNAFVERSLGQGRILYCAFPLELADELGSIGKVYRHALERASVAEVYRTSVTDPGVLICPTRLPNATLYVLMSETSFASNVVFRDATSGAQVSVPLTSGRASLLLIDAQGKTAAAYPPNP